MKIKTLEDLKREVKRLSDVLDHPEPTVMSWLDFYEESMAAICEYWNQMTPEDVRRFRTRRVPFGEYAGQLVRDVPDQELAFLGSSAYFFCHVHQYLYQKAKEEACEPDRHQKSPKNKSRH